jgi:cytochrome c-type biogenesis protein CcmH/NrfG
MATTSQCATCGLTYGSVAAFDTRRTGSYGEPISQGRKLLGAPKSQRRCLTVAEIQARGMRQNARGWWMLPRASVPQQEGDPAEALEEMRKSVQTGVSEHPCASRVPDPRE